MAAPNLGNTNTGATDAGGAWSFSATGFAGLVAGDIIILQILQDGTTAGAVALTGAAGVEDLAGTDNAWTQISGPLTGGAWAVGSATSGHQYLYIGRALTTTPASLTASGTNSTSEDLYARMYEFQNCSTGTTLATVIENATAGTATNGVGTSTTCSDTAVQTLAVDRLACNFGALSDDLMGIAVFTGMTGGTWGNFQVYEEASGTDGTVFAEFATMATAGTIDGGSDTITSIGWGVIGFALIGTTVALGQEHYRFRNDDGDETTATWKVALDTTTSYQLADKFRVRFSMHETAGGDPANFAPTLQYSQNAGTWTNIGAAGADAPIRAVASPNVADNAATTQQISSGTFTAGSFEEATAAAAAIDLGRYGLTEFEWSLEVNAGASSPFAVSDTIQLRVNFMAFYDNTAQFTIASAGGTVSDPTSWINERRTPRRRSMQRW
jgi:hypothetical protein